MLFILQVVHMEMMLFYLLGRMIVGLINIVMLVHQWDESCYSNHLWNLLPDVFVKGYCVGLALLGFYMEINGVISYWIARYEIDWSMHCEVETACWYVPVMLKCKSNHNCSYGEMVGSIMIGLDNITPRWIKIAKEDIGGLGCYMADVIELSYNSNVWCDKLRMLVCAVLGFILSIILLVNPLGHFSLVIEKYVTCARYKVSLGCLCRSLLGFLVSWLIGSCVSWLIGFLYNGLIIVSSVNGLIGDKSVNRGGGAIDVNLGIVIVCYYEEVLCVLKDLFILLYWLMSIYKIRVASRNRCVGTSKARSGEFLVVFASVTLSAWLSHHNMIFAACEFISSFCREIMEEFG